MLMPEAAVHKNNRTKSSKDQVRTPWQEPIVHPVSQAEPMKKPTDAKLRSRILGANAGHHPASRRRINDVHRC
jgi:hypothetical protein